MLALITEFNDPKKYKHIMISLTPGLSVLRFIYCNGYSILNSLQSLQLAYDLLLDYLKTCEHILLEI